MLDAVTMHVVSTADNGIVNRETKFHFRQEGSLVTASYAGGKIQSGSLVGRLTDQTLNFAYCQIRASGELDHGVSSCHVFRDKETNKMTLEEHFEMTVSDRIEKGINIFKEI